MMYLHLQLDHGVVTGTLQSSFPDPPDGGKQGLPAGRTFITIGDEDHPEFSHPHGHWHGGHFNRGGKFVKAKE